MNGYEPIMMRFIPRMNIARTGKAPSDFCLHWSPDAATACLSPNDGAPNTYCEFLSGAHLATKLYLDRDDWMPDDNEPSSCTVEEHRLEVVRRVGALLEKLSDGDNSLTFVMATRHGLARHGKKVLYKLSFRVFVQGMTLPYTAIPRVLRYAGQDDKFWDMSVYKASEQLLATINCCKGGPVDAFDRRVLTPGPCPDGGTASVLEYIVQHSRDDWPVLDIPTDWDPTPTPVTPSKDKKHEELAPTYVTHGSDHDGDKTGTRTPDVTDRSSRAYRFNDDDVDAHSETYTESVTMPPSVSQVGSVYGGGAGPWNCSRDDSILEMTALVETCWSGDRAVVYDTWVQAGLCLFNSGGRTDLYFQLWVAFSRRAGAEFCGESMCHVKWSTFKKERTTGASLSVGSAHTWAKLDAPAEYARLCNGSLRRMVLLASVGTHGPCANVITHMYRERFVCVAIRKKGWFEFVGHRWAAVEDGYVIRNLMETEVTDAFHSTSAWCGQRAREAERQGQDREQKDMVEKGAALLRVAVNMGETNFKNNILSACGDKLFNSEFFGKLDVADHLIGFDNGIYDVDAGVFRAGKPDDYISMTTGYDFIETDDRDVQDEIMRFIRSVMPSSEMVEYLLMVMAYLLHGRKHLEVLFFLTGISGRNGKGVCCTLLKACLGSYYYEPSAELFTCTNKTAGAPNAELAKSRGKLAMVASEPSDADGSTFNVNKLKNWRGNDTISVRDLYVAPISFRPKFAMILVMNQKPMLDKLDQAIAKSIRIIDFPFEFVESPTLPHHRLIDAGIKERFEDAVAYRQQFMRIMLATRLRHPDVFKHRGGMPCPEAVKTATDEYMEDNNEVGNAIAGWLMKQYEFTGDPADKVKAGDMLSDLLGDTVAASMRLNAVKFKRAMEGCGHVAVRFNNAKQYVGFKRRMIACQFSDDTCKL